MKSTTGKSLLLALLAGTTLAFASAGFAQNPPPDDGGGDDGGSDGGGSGGGGSYTRGPDPTESYLEADSGPYNVATSSVSSFVSGFGGGTIHYPTDTTGSMGGIVVIPGYVSYESSIEWWGPKLASHGFVVMTIDTESIYDQPGARADQINAALDYLVDQSNSSSSAISGMVDPNRLAAVGWSMGGGGTLQVAAQPGRLKAAMPLAPWNSSINDFDQIQTPTLFFACESDSVAPVNSHASPFYNDIPSSTDKAYFELNNGSHTCGNGGNSYNAVLSKYGVSWMKLQLDEDTRYEPFLCGPDHESDYQVSEYRGTCPY